MFSCAYADVAQQTKPSLLGFLPMLAFMVLLYFILIRPQQKKQKAHQAMISALKPGDKVMTGGGLLGQIVRVINDNEVLVAVSDNVQCKFIKSAVVAVLNDENKNTVVANKS